MFQSNFASIKQPLLDQLHTRIGFLFIFFFASFDFFFYSFSSFNSKWCSSNGSYRTKCKKKKKKNTQTFQPALSMHAMKWIRSTRPLPRFVIFIIYFFFSFCISFCFHYEIQSELVRSPSMLISCTLSHACI